MSGGVKQGRDR